MKRGKKATSVLCSHLFLSHHVHCSSVHIRVHVPRYIVTIQFTSPRKQQASAAWIQHAALRALLPSGYSNSGLFLPWCIWHSFGYQCSAGQWKRSWSTAHWLRRGYELILIGDFLREHTQFFSCIGAWVGVCGWGWGRMLRSNLHFIHFQCRVEGF